MNRIHSIHEAYNAKTLSTKQICDRFIITEHFSKLSGQGNSLLVGPRGSGKTTLMKMLQVEAMEIWMHTKADQYRNSIEYSGVFISTDIIWKQQFESIISQIKNKELAKKLVTEVFIYHTLEQITGTLEFRVNRNVSKKYKFRAVNIEKKDEKELVLELSHIWHVKPILPTIRSLKASVNFKIQELINNTNRVLEENIELNELFQTNTFTDLLHTASSGVSIINSYINEHGKKWALLFDELELAPEQIIQPLIDSLRGGPDNIILKLSLSPYHKDLKIGGDPLGHSEKDDFNYIDLTSGRKKKSGKVFAVQLCQQLYEAKGYEGSLETRFKIPEGPSPEKVFVQLAGKDNSFKEYLEKNGIDAKHVEGYKEKNKRPTIRKIEYVALLRNHVFKSDMSKRTLRRPHNYYGGFDNLAKSLEYNPRMLTSTMNELLSGLGKSKKQIEIFAQIEAIQNSKITLTSLLNTLRSKYLSCKTVKGFIDIIGKHFREGIVGSEFNGEPVGSFSIGDEVALELDETIGRALNAGALIKISQKGVESNICSIRNSRFRLSFLFAHDFSLPLQVMKEISLHEIFRDSLPPGNDPISIDSYIQDQGS